ncbi:transporter [Pelobium manganitolerans]|uniref:Transporter n=1 Tax=Pelobium manganitolerans TaxID=1842495 RepID=A0A419S442_9SPHI|nr:TolC family protein [Pelobium manganitolerans]RKD14427.1 transporter [Pelobium manganitolerans]
MKNLLKYSLCLLFLPFGDASAQQILSLKEAVSIALANNYDIKLSNNENEIAENDLRYGKTALLPSLTGNFSNSGNIQNTQVDLANGDSREANNAKTTNLNYGVTLNWKIFDGLQMFANYDRLQELQKLGELNAQLTVQNTIADVIAAYYSLAAQKKQLEATETALEVSQVRLKNAQSRYTLGKGAKLELLAAKVDMNTDTTQLLMQQDAIKSAKVRLNQLLSRDLQIDFDIDDDILIDQSLVYQNLKNLIDTQNPDLRTAEINRSISEIYIRQVKGARLPVISLNSGYNFAKSTSPPTGFALRSNSHGLNYGVTASLNIFNGWQQNRAEKNAKLSLDNANLDYERVKQDVNAQLLTSYQTYQTSLQLITLEEKNVAVAEENLKITLEKYRLGSIVPLELREAQRNYMDATARYSNALYQAKISEISLKEITGSIAL